MKKISVALCCLLVAAITANLNAQEYEYKFRLYLKDKGKSSYSIKKPEQFLSQKAIDRRANYGIAIDESDLPISDKYVEKIEKVGGIVVAKSKWQKTIAVHCADSANVEALKKLSFVDNVKLVWRGKAKKENKAYPDTALMFKGKRDNEDYYGLAERNIRTLNGHHLHNAGHKGQGVDVAVIDAGFSQLPNIELIKSVNIAGYKGFVYQYEDLFHQPNDHGLCVLSCMGTNVPHTFVGTAPEATYWLLGTEDSRSEFPIEEDYWAAAVEYADSLGVKVANTSLGYNSFDAPTKGYTHDDLDGKTAFISNAAAMAADKGLLIVCSAGNSGAQAWRKITAPGDAENVLTVGAIVADSVVASFSSRGYTADMRVKPDVMALGVAAHVVNQRGAVNPGNGTSFSSPIMCGITACLVQALPELTNKEIIKVIQQSADRYQNPDETYGYGIPDMMKALVIGKELIEKKKNSLIESDIIRFVSSENGKFEVISKTESAGKYSVKLTKQEKGKEKKIWSQTLKKDQYAKSLKTDKKGTYKLYITGNGTQEEFTVIF